MPEIGGLAPLDAGLMPQPAALAKELRTLFSGLDISLTRYAARVHMDKSVVSRYLSGERIPRWEFVHQLLVQSTLKRDGVPPTRQVVIHLQTLHHAALKAGGAPGHLVQLLQEQLADADAQVRRAETREQELELALQEAKHHVAELEIRLRELEGTTDRRRDDLLTELAARRSQFDSDRELLLAEIDRLTQELQEAHRRRVVVEERCAELERQLEQIPDEQDASYRVLLPQAETARDHGEEIEDQLRRTADRAADCEEGDGSYPAISDMGAADRTHIKHSLALVPHEGWLSHALTPAPSVQSPSIGFNGSTGFFNWLLSTGDVVCDEQTLRLHGLAPDAVPHFETFLAQIPPEDVSDVMRMLQPVLSTVGEYILEYRVRWPDGSMHALEIRGRVVPGPDGGPLRLMGAVADITERRAAEEAVRSEARAASRIQAVTAGLAAASSLADVREAVGRALPTLGADALIIADVGRRTEVLLTCGRGAEHPLRVADDGPVRTAMTYESALFYRNTAELYTRFPQVKPIVEEFGLEGWAFLPLSGVPRMRGICLLGYENEVLFDEPERATLVLAASAIGQAVHRAMQYDTEHSFALALQEGMLPRTLKFGPGVQGAWRYEAATTGIQVGGDWYDSVPLDDGSTILIIGDVEGHNVHAAGMMYRLRTAVRTYAAEKHPIDEVLRRAHEFVMEINEEIEYPVFASCLIAQVDPETRKIAASRAGHIPPIMIPPGRPAQLPQNEVGALLGVPSNGRYPVWTVPYEPGTRLVMCTDGLLTSIDNDLDQGLRRTLGCLNNGEDVDLEVLTSLLLDANRPRGPWKDDVAVLSVELS